MERQRHALDIIDDGIRAQAQPDNLKRGVAAVLAAMTRAVERNNLWPTIWADLYDRQQIRNGHARADGIAEIDKQYKRVRVLLKKAADEHK